MLLEPLNPSYMAVSVVFLSEIQLEYISFSFIDFQARDRQNCINRFWGEEEGLLQQFLARATFSPFSRPSHLGILVQFSKIKLFFKNLAMLWHKIWIDNDYIMLESLKT